MALIATVGRCVLLDHSASETPTLPDSWILADSGTSALAVAIADAGRRSENLRDAEVVIPAYCCPDVLSAVRTAGARPVVVDLEPGTSWLDENALLAALSERTVAVVAINFLGIPERLERLSRITRRHGCKLIDDACQAAPRLEQIEDNADCRIHSFGRGKPVSLLHGGAAIGLEGVQAATRLLESGPGPDRPHSLRLRARAYNLARHPLIFGSITRLGLAGRTVYSAPRPPGRMSDFAAEILPAAIEGYWRSERNVEPLLTSALREGRAGSLLSLTAHLNVADLRLLRMPLIAPDRIVRDTMIRRLLRAGIAASPLYDRVLADIPGTRLTVPDSRFPGGRFLADRLLTLPLHAEISEDNIATIANVLDACVT